MFLRWTRRLSDTPKPLSPPPKSFKDWCDFFVIPLGYGICSHVDEGGKGGYASMGFMSNRNLSIIFLILSPGRRHTWWVHGSSWRISVSIPHSRESPTATILSFFSSVSHLGIRRGACRVRKRDEKPLCGRKGQLWQDSILTGKGQESISKCDSGHLYLQTELLGCSIKGTCVNGNKLLKYLCIHPTPQSPPHSLILAFPPWIVQEKWSKSKVGPVQHKVIA